MDDRRMNTDGAPAPAPAAVPDDGPRFQQPAYLRESLQSSEGRFAQLIQNSFDTIVILDAGGIQRYVSPSAERVHGYAPAELVDIPVIEQMIHPDDQARVQAAFRQIVETGQGEVQYRHRCKAGGWVCLEARGTNQLDNPDIRGVVVNVRDITERQKAEAALRESEERFKRMVNEAPLGIAIVDSLTARFYLVNSALARITGRSIAELERLDWVSITHPDDIQPDKDNMAAMNAGRVPGFQLEKRYLHPDGHYFWVNITVAPMHAEDRSKPRHLLMVEDISERKRSEEGFRIFKESVANSSDAVGMSTPEGRHYYQNRAFDELFGTIGENPRETLFVDHAVGAEVFRTIMAGGQWTGEVRMYAPDRRILDILLRAYANKDKSGRITALVGIHTDITVRKRAETALAEAKSRIRAIVDSTDDLIWSVDLERHGLVTWNRAVADYFRSARGLEIAGGMRPEELFPPDSPLAAEWHALYTRAATEGAFLVEKLLSAGTHILLLSFNVMRRDGRPFGISVFGRNITAQRKLEETLRQAAKMDAVGRLAGGVAHDFNNMLHAILGNTALLLDALPPDSPLRADAEEIQDCARRSAELTRQLLAFARKQVIAPVMLDLNGRVDGMLKLLRRLIGENIHLAWRPAATSVLVRMDPSQLDQVLANLCVNARDAITGTGTVTIETGRATFDEAFCAAHPDYAPGDYALLAVSDDGCGMGKEVLAHLFEPFFTTKGLGHGNGLGLATVHGAVRQNHGFIAVHSELGKGTTFRIYLPWYREAPAPQQAAVPQQSPVRGHETILLVEDEPVIARICRRVLEGLGYRVLTAETPGQAMSLAETGGGEIALVLTDVIMPEMNGLELSERLRARHPNMKRLFMSGYTADAIARHGVLDAGVYFLQKPFSPRELADKVRTVLKS